MLAHRRTALTEALTAMPPDERARAADGFRAFARAAGERPEAEGRFTLVPPARGEASGEASREPEEDGRGA